MKLFEAYNFKDVLRTSTRASWQIEDVLPEGSKLDFSRDLLPENLARTADAPGLNAAQRRTLNHIRGHEYLTIFGLVEEFILPFVMDHVRADLPNADDVRVRALMQFAAEEAKHIQLFKRFRDLFAKGFGVGCEVIGPPQAVSKIVLAHQPLSVALFVLMIEWMTQSHYVDSVRGTSELDPLFANLLRCHWIEEAQHAKLDTLMVEALAEGMSGREIKAAVDGFLEIAAFFDIGCQQQAKFNAQALERAALRKLPAKQRAALIEQQHQALRWTYLGSGLVHKQFRTTLGALSPAELARIDAISPQFC
jgi:hypothetical protein